MSAGTGCEGRGAPNSWNGGSCPTVSGTNLVEKVQEREALEKVGVNQYWWLGPWIEEVTRLCAEVQSERRALGQLLSECRVCKLEEGKRGGEEPN